MSDRISPDSTDREIDPSAPQVVTTLNLTPSRKISGLVGLIAGALAVTTGMMVAVLGSVASPIDAVGSSFIDRTPRWLKELAIDWFGTNDKTALRIGIVIVLILVSLVSGSLSNKSPSPLITAIVIFSFLGALSASERSGSTWVSIAAPCVGSIVGITIALILLRQINNQWLLKHFPRESQVPLGWDRRRFIRSASTASAGAVVLGALAQNGEQNRIDRIESQIPDSLPGTVESSNNYDNASAPGELSYITPNDDFYRIDTALSFPNVDLDTWQLRIHGMVDNEIVLSYQDILDMPQIERTITICCVSNEIGGPYIGNAVWQGVLLKDLLERAGVNKDAEQVFSRSIDGWTCGFPLEVALDGRDAMLAIGMNGEPLPLEHGFPARLIVPGIYGYVSATKWLKEIVINKWSDAMGYWIPLGWARDAPIKTQSRIDVPRKKQELQAGPNKIAGVAWAQHTGIEKVEVRIDDGEWNTTELSDDLTDDAWRLWTYDWMATSGKHTIQVRATDKSGYTQTDVVTSVAPDGATGWHTRKVEVA
jgi:DMSO/TMAO reductase YedYZ molybdopterin-dependent catalytic subunit